MNTNYIEKPAVIEDKYVITAIIGTYDRATTPDSPLIDKGYTKSELAVDEINNKVQVVVTANTKKGLNAFKLDYPSAVIDSEKGLDDTNEWRILAFPTLAMPDDAAPLDNFYTGLVEGSVKETQILQINEINRENKENA